MAKPRSTRVEHLDAEFGACMTVVGQMLDQASVDRVSPVLRRLLTFLSKDHRVNALQDVSHDAALAFVTARLESGLKASTATMHDRRTSVRLLFRAARRLKLASADPTVDVVLPPRCSRGVRPLTDDEVELCRDVSLWSLTSRRFAAAWALSEATGRGAELACISAVDLDLPKGRVWLHGGKRTTDRWGALTDWGIRVLRGRLTEVGSESGLVYAGTGDGIAGQVATCSSISTVLLRAGLGGEPDVRPASVAGWAGRKLFEGGADIAEVARRLGVRSLDQAAAKIAWDWSA